MIKAPKAPKGLETVRKESPPRPSWKRNPITPAGKIFGEPTPGLDDEYRKAK